MGIYLLISSKNEKSDTMMQKYRNGKAKTGGVLAIFLGLCILLGKAHVDFFYWVNP